MEKVVVGQKVVRNTKYSNRSWNSACNKAGINPLNPVTVSLFGGHDNLVRFNELPEMGQFWDIEYFDPFVEPSEASPVTFVKRDTIPLSVGCLVRRKSAYQDSRWNSFMKDEGQDPNGEFVVSHDDRGTLTLNLARLTDKTMTKDLGRWGDNYFDVTALAPEVEKVADSDGWIEWHGGKCPVPDRSMVDYRLRDNLVFLETSAGRLRWGHENVQGDIVAYRKHVKEKTEEQKLRDRLDILESGYNEEINKRMNAEREASDKIAKLESQLNDELHSRMSREKLIARLRVILGENGRELKDRRSQVEMMLGLLNAADNKVKELDQIIANHSKLMQAQDVVIEQSRENVKLALVLAASPEVSGDAVDYLARLVRKDEQDQTAKIVKLINDRYVVEQPF